MSDRRLAPTLLEPFFILFYALLASAVLAGGSGDLEIGPATELTGGVVSATAGDDGFLLVWQDHPTVLARELSSSGSEVGLPKALDDLDSPSPGIVGAEQAGSHFFAAWSDPSGPFDALGRPAQVFAQRLDGTVSVSPVLLAGELTGGNAGLVSAAARQDGRFVVAWNWAFQYGPSGNRSQGFSAADAATGQASLSGQARRTLPTSAGFVTLLNDGFNHAVQLLDGDGDEVDSEIAIDPGGRPSDLASSRGEGYLVVLRDTGMDHVFARRLDENFDNDGDAFQISEMTGIERDPGIAETPGGGFLISWLRDDGTRSSRVRYMRPDGVLEPSFELASLTALNLAQPDIAVDRHGRFIATWPDDGTVWIRHGRLERSIEIDAFDTDQGPLTLSAGAFGGTSASGVASGLDMVGGERDAELELLGGTSGMASLEVTGGQLVHEQTGDVTAISKLTFDQVDGDASTLDSTGLRALDLTAGGSRDAFLVDVASAGSGASLEIEVGDGTNTSSFTLALPGGATGEVFTIPFAELTGTADLGAAGYLSLEIDGSSAPGVDVTLNRLATTSLVTGTKSATDLDGGDLEPGDVLEYEVEIENPADSHGVAASDVTFSDIVPAGTELLCTGGDAPSTTQGSVSGCIAAESGQLDVDLGTLADGASATVTFRVQVLESARGEICNDGLVGSSSLADVLTDDASTADASDATCVTATAPAELSLAQSFVVIHDADSSTDATPGDRLRFTVIASYTGGDRDATGLVLTADAADATLVTGSVTTSQGTVTSGNGVGDTEIEVALGTLASSGQATVTFELDIDSLSAYVPDFRLATEVEGPGAWARDLYELAMTAFTEIEAPMRDILQVDADLSGAASPGDTLRYQVEVTNVGGRDTEILELRDFDFQDVNLVAGSVSTSQGTVVTGNTMGDTEIVVDFDLLEGLGVGTATVTFDVMIDDPLGAGVDEVSAQGEAARLGFAPTLTDDPDTAAENDPTVTPIVFTSSLIFSDGFESGDTTAWSATSS